MKNLSVIFIIVTLSFFSLSAQNVEVPETQNPLIFKVSASWCTLCGGWGWNFFDNIYEDNKDDAVFLTVHHSGQHTNEIASAVADNFNVFGQPRFFFDGVDQNVSSSNASSKRTSFMDMVNDVISSNPSIQVGFDAFYSGSDLNVEYSVELFEDLTGDYNIAFYVSEKSFIGYQANQGNNADHTNLLRGEMSGNDFGSQLFSNGASAGTIFNGSLDMDLGSYDPQNLQIVAVIWEQTGSSFSFVNTNHDQDVQENTTSQVSGDILRKSINVYPTVADGFINVSVPIEVVQAGEIKSISLIDQFGRKMLELNESELTQELIKIEKPGFIEPGIHFLHISSAEEIITKKIFFK